MGNIAAIGAGRTVYDEREFCARLRGEIRRLEERAKVLEGQDKKVVADMAQIMTAQLQGLERSLQASCGLEGEEREEALASIIRILNEIDDGVNDLDRLVVKNGRGFNFTVHDATCIIDRFFFNCQIAEERIKDAGQRKHITKAQVDELNEQLAKAVARIMEISKQSDALVKMLQEKYGTGVTG
jgi:DNA anti-recombination protein RmuC